jgi:CubicO group peptidase (beta-lactamase class C family)
MKNLFLLTLLTFSTVFCAPDWTNLNNWIQTAIDNGQFPGAAIAIGTSKSITLTKVFGGYQYRRNLFQPTIRNDTRWDLDRLSPAVSLVPAIMHLIENGKLNVGDHVSKYEFDFDNNAKKNLSIGDFMLHNSGFEAVYPGALPKTPEEVIKHINAAKLNYTTGNKTLYSDEGLVVLQEVIMKIAQDTLENWVFRVNAVIGLRSTSYTTLNGLYRIAPTAVVAGKGLLAGRAYDPMADLFSNQAGHAGIFSTHTDVLRFFRILLAGGQLPNETRAFQTTTVNNFTTKPTNLKYNNSRTYIFDTVPSDDNPPVGTKVTPEKNFGLWGQTGTIAWADKTRDLAIVFLTNSPYLGNNVQAFKDLSNKIFDEVYAQLGF